ncbi:type I polyketide synthase [Xylariales sp. PMI_506]|nr:type I polyketide synthase [Xylariales sp. PMI_506]
MAINGISNGYSVSDNPHHANSEPKAIAIIGMACRFAGDATSPDKLWRLCSEGKDAWAPIPTQRFDVASWYHTENQKKGKCNVQSGYFLNQDISRFDGGFFNLSKDIASALDPQMRLLLESTYEALEDSGISMDRLAGSNASVFTATFTKDYHELQTKDPELLARNFMLGSGTATLSNRVSHFFDLQGPSMTVDTGCSGSLVALHQACRSIRSGESSISIVGGVNLMLHQDPFIYIGSSGTLSPDGRCYAWDARANGYGRGEGVGILVLKPLAAALQDGDRVHAVIKETAVNQDGKTHTMWSPSVEAQTRLIKECYRSAGLNISETGYVEAHMTGTPTGDPIEAEALALTFGASRDPNDPVLVGSVKPNVGHTEAASGLAAVIKAVMALKYGQIPANQNYATPNPKIPLKLWHLRVPTALTEWPVGKLRRASVNNFGYGGTNAHVILEAAPETSHLVTTNGGSTRSHQDSRIYVFSAKDSSTVRNVVSAFESHFRQCIESGRPLYPTDLAYTLTERRSLLPWRVALRASTIEELCDKTGSSSGHAHHATRPPRLGFVFNGQGGQWHGMARELIYAYPVFNTAISEAERILNEYGSTWSLTNELMRDEHSTRVSEVHISQPVTVAIQICLVDLLRSWQITPSAVTSHSSGEIAAAYAAGALSFAEALGVAYFRGEIAQKQSKLMEIPGGMLAVGLSSTDIQEYIADTVDGTVVVACINSQRSITLSGDLKAIEEVSKRLSAKEIFHRKLKVPMAYHSHHMLPMAEEYIRRLQDILPICTEWRGISYTSPTTGKAITSPEDLGPSHWSENLTNPVQFSQAFEAMCFGADGGIKVDFIVEVGAHGTLAGPIRQILQAQQTEITYGSCLKRMTDAVETMQDLVCELVARGYPADLREVNRPHGTAAEKPKFVPDLPLYPWNHANSYWDEPRIGKEMRYRAFRPHELLGSPLPGGNRSNYTWRNFLRLSEVDWLIDHQVGSKVVLPGAAYISMAIEAIRLLVDASEETIHGYHLRDIEILNALVVPDTLDGVEIQLCLRPCRDADLEHAGWYQYDICSLGAGEVWIDNCRGYVSADTNDKAKFDTSYEPPPPHRATFLGTTDDSEVSDIDGATIFRRMREMGVKHGPAFQNLLTCRTVRDKAVTNFVVGTSVSGGDSYVLHPTTLDSIFQAAYGSLPIDTQRHMMFLPRSIGRVFIPLSLCRHAGSTFQAFSELVQTTRRGYGTDINVLEMTGDVPQSALLQVERLFVQAVLRDTDDKIELEHSVCSKFQWEPDMLHNMPASLRASMITTPSNQEAQLERDSIRASYHLIDAALKNLENADHTSWKPHHRIFYRWMETVVERGRRGDLARDSQLWTKATEGMKQMLFDDLSAADGACQMLIRVGRALPDIFMGEIEPLELMMEGDLLRRYYEEYSVCTRSSKHLVEVVKLFSTKCPGAQVLEIGAGTGGGTKWVLDAFSARAEQAGLPGTLLGSYTFTDISSGFFPAAKDRFSSWQGLFKFQELDIEKDPVAQSFAEGQYDLVVASLVLHATKNLYETLVNVRKLLKPGGKLILLETTKDRLDMQLVFGPLPGWWRGDTDGRQMSPNISVQAWGDLLHRAGFSGLDLELPDCTDSEIQMLSLILSTAVPTNIAIAPISIVHSTTESAPPQSWLCQLSQQIQDKTGVRPLIETIDQAQEGVQDKLCIFMGEMERPLVSHLDEVTFGNLRALLLQAGDVLWLTCGGLINAREPLFSASLGLLRTLRLEDTNKLYVHLDFEENLTAQSTVWTPDKIDHIIQVLMASLWANPDSDNVDREYAVQDSVLHVPRAYPNKLYNQICNDTDRDAAAELQLFEQPERPLVWEIPNSGLLTDLYFVDDHTWSSGIPSGMIEVKPKAFGLNFRDVMDALGLLDPTTVAHEMAGVITKLGPNTEDSGLKVGDRVCGTGTGLFASRCHAYSTSLTKIPHDMSFEDAASIPTIFVTAYHSLITVGRLRKGESVLIHAATGGVGQAAIVLAQHVGAEIFATCSTDEKRQLLIQRYNIDNDHILSSRDSSFAAAIMKMTKGKGVDVVLNSLSGPLLKATWDSIARFGRFLEIGKVDMLAGRNLGMTPFTRCALYTSVDVIQLLEYDRTAMHEALVESVRICHARQTQSVYPITTYSISQMEDAMRKMQSGTHMGKLVLVPREGDLVKVVSRPKDISLDNPDATYLVVGGLGGIGRAVAEWMIEKGARNILIVSRHATSHPDVESLSLKGAKSRCSIHFHNCDIADEASLVGLLGEWERAGLPPIQGLVNGAMVLDDTIFERMSFEQWCHAVQPKINGSWNLHKHLPNLSFFVMLSSVAGVLGSASQANYTAGGALQDALARHRVRNGQPGVALDLGVVLSAGYVADLETAGDYTVRERVEKTGLVSMDISQVLRIIEAAIRQPPGHSVDDSQVVLSVTEDTATAWHKIGRPQDPRFGTLQLARSQGQALQGSSLESKSNSTMALVSALSNPSTTMVAAIGLIVDALVSKIGDIFNIPCTNIDEGLPMSHYGVDSLVAVELRKWLSSVVRAKVSIFDILQGIPLREFGGMIAKKSDFMVSKPTET